MQCERVRQLLSPYLDGELSAAERRAVAAHIEQCRACAALVADFQRIGRTIAEAGAEPAPSSLALRVRASLAREAEAQESEALPSLAKSTQGHSFPPVRALMRQAAVIAAACVLSALATWWIVSTADRAGRIEHDVLAAHARSLLQESPIQVASSDAHTVKPWFAGRVDFAPDVKDLTADGFPLLGGRLDYVGGRRFGAVVYKRRLHIINVFIWPSAGGETAPPRLIVRNGYNLLAWSRNGIAYWAVSDLGAGDLRQLQSLL
jgi:anti-sigma factor RsiW